MRRFRIRSFHNSLLLSAMFAIAGGLSAAEMPTVGKEGRIVDLSAYHNIRLDDPNYDGPGKAVAKLKPEFDGLPFQLTGQLVTFGRHFAGRGTLWPMEVEGIPIQARFKELHLLHHSRWAGVENETIARLRLNYADGKSHEFPIRFGHHVRDWSFLPSYETEEIGDPNAKVIWRDPKMEVSRYKGFRRLWKTVFINPRPEAGVISMDLLSEKTYAAYTLVGATIAAADPDRKLSPHVPFKEPKRNFTGKLTIKVVDLSTGKPINDALINPGVNTMGVGVICEMLRTDAKGEAVLKYWKKETTSINYRVSANGYTSEYRSFRTLPATNDKVSLRKAETIGGLVKNTDGKPLPGAFVQLTYAQSAARGPGSVGDAHAVTDQNGKWSLAMAPRDFTSVRLSIKHRDYAEETARYSGSSVDGLKSGKATVVLSPGFAIAGRVTDLKKNGVKNAIVSYGRSSGYRFALSDAEGYYFIEIPKDDNITLSAAAAGFQPAKRAFRVSSVSPVQDFTLSK